MNQNDSDELAKQLQALHECITEFGHKLAAMLPDGPFKDKVMRDLQEMFKDCALGLSYNSSKKNNTQQ